MAYRIKDYVDTLMDILSRKDRSWDKDRLIKEARRERNFPNDRKLIMILDVLVATGNVTQYGTGTYASFVLNKETVRLDDHTEQRIKRLQDQVAIGAAEVERFGKVAREQVAAAEEWVNKASSSIAVVQLKMGSKVVKQTKGLFHNQFDKILKLAMARMNIFIYGPTGCGKSHICAQLAEALNLSFSFVSCTSGMSEGILGGRLLPVGKQGTFEYVISEFIRAYENGGVFLLDEIDAADPNVLLLVNAALTNGKVAVSNRPEEPYATRHADFVCIAAANTVGTGADRLYSGRNKLDAATLDRFQIGKMVMDYDERVEVILCPNKQLRTRLLGYRKAIMAHRLERVMSTRFMRDAHKMVGDHGWSDADVDRAFFSGWREDEVNKVKSYRS
ncbi:hypothetical protein LCGC14_1426550 [marine sediment metagenome]|uniref:AAA+ ATPase domain-containing protein n=1 Tax=marine sediment metagenome TaxID=412755 RepID=A0A0F9MRH2_9ZZZZ